MKQHIKLTALILVAALLLSGCGGSSTDDSDSGSHSEFYQALSILMHQPYIDATGISVHYSSERKKIVSQIEDALNGTPVSVAKTSNGLFGDDYYELTNGPLPYYYFGEMKDNRPDGFGVLVKGGGLRGDHSGVDITDIYTLNDLIYAGNFSKGKFNGYGVIFESAICMLDEVKEHGAIKNDALNMINIYNAAHATADGNWKNGKLTGKANLFTFELYGKTDDATYTLLKENAPKDYWSGAFYPSITVTEANNGKADGDTKYYAYGVLMYDGKMDDGKRSGKGVSYYPNGQKEYDGKWKNDKYNGEGTLYDENGKKIYSGKWKNGYYSS